MRIGTIASRSGDRAAIILSDGTIGMVETLVPHGPADVLGVLDAGVALWSALAEAARVGRGGARPADTRLRAPIPRPRRNVMCVGWNYSDHITETAGLGAPTSPVPEWPTLFSKNPRTVIGTGDAVWHPAPYSDELDWEVELAAVIGRAGRDITERDGLAHVFGYTIANDVSVRDVQTRHGKQLFRGKNFDTHLPLGPWIVTADEIGDAHALRITSRVNGVTKQDSNTRHMVFKLPRLIRDLSAGAELEPGDVVLTGTPSGVGFGRDPKEYLKVGDVVEVEIERIGTLRNSIEPRPAYRGP
jgi:2-keto-4-pentenoate hydratase/2-oxohepta-3-ene-1,7-dioic acid hydratase in catechol pathway